MQLPEPGITDIASAALGYEALGWHVVPMSSKKRPLVRWRECGKPTAKELKSFFEMRCTSCEAFALALPPNVLVLDIDHRPERGWKANDILAEFSKRYEIDHAPIATTPSGGFHIYLHSAEGAGVKNWTSKASKLPIEGIDIRTGGGLIIAPPSRRGGISYTWEKWSESIPDAHAKLIMDLTVGNEVAECKREFAPYSPSNGSKSKRYIQVAVEHEFNAVAFALTGHRNMQLFKSAAKLGRFVVTGELGRSELIDGLLTVSRSNGLIADDGQRAVLATIESGLRAAADPQIRH